VRREENEEVFKENDDLAMAFTHIERMVGCSPDGVRISVRGDNSYL
jgi:hypothetical protein